MAAIANFNRLRVRPPERKRKVSSTAKPGARIAVAKVAADVAFGLRRD
jgi:hypothetical protein